MSGATSITPRPTAADRSAHPGEEPADFLGSLAESAGLCMARLDQKLNVLRANEYFRSQFSPSGEDLRGHSVYQFLHPRVHTRLRYQFQYLAEGRRTWFTERMVTLRSAATDFDGALTGVAGHGRVGSTGVTVLLKAETAHQTGEREGVMNDRLSELSARVLECVAAGESTPEIALRLRLSRQGVEYHISLMMRRTGVSNRTALVSRMFITGVLGSKEWPPRVLAEYIR